MSERVMRVEHNENGVFGVYLNGVKVPRARAVSFSADANEAEIVATLTFGVSAVDLVDTVAAITRPDAP